MQLTAFHHLTAVTAQAAANHDFYTRVLGMRLVKKTVNQDDVSAYHLFYGDGDATPGSDITFFDWPAERERRGSNSVTRTGLRVASEESLAWWLQWFRKHRVPNNGVSVCDGRACLDFEDPERQRLSLVVDETPRDVHSWRRSRVPPEHQILGLGPITMSVPRLEPTDVMLTRVMNMRKVRDYRSVGDGTTPHLNPLLDRGGEKVRTVSRTMMSPAEGSGQKETSNGGNGVEYDYPPSPSSGAADECEHDDNLAVHVYQMGGVGPAAELHVMVDPSAPPARLGAGGVHHVAFRTPTFEEYDAWVERLEELGIRSSGPIDRYYFRSLYFREPNGVLFEIATDGPGFATDEPLDQLGQRLALPPFLEPRRSDIEAGLKKLQN
jgi:glyoxalase family protein